MENTFSCPKCSARVPVGQRFCGTCGEKFEYRCIHCGAVINITASFCTNCGQPLTPPAQQRSQTLLETGTMPYQPQPQAQALTPPQAKPERKKPGLWLIACLGSAAIVLWLSAILYAYDTRAQPKSDTGLYGGFIFQELLPPPSYPPSTEPRQKPAPVIDLPDYTITEVIELAKSLSPECKVLVKGAG